MVHFKKFHIKKKYYLWLPSIFAAMSLLINQFFVINVTDSMPLGIYLKTGGLIKRGDIVLFCLSNDWQKIGLQNHYVLAGRGCHGASPLIKKVVAVPGNDVQLLRDGIIVNAVFYSYKTLTTDSIGRPLLMLQRGHYAKTKGYWVLGMHSPLSWDSRYFGAIPPSQLSKKLIPLMTWK